jgi:hypothetical protein
MVEEPGGPGKKPALGGTSRRIATNGGNPMRRLLLSVPLLLALTAPCWAWGAKGHNWSVHNAVEALPEGNLRDWADGRRDELILGALAPDFELKDGIDGPLEGPNHYLNIETIVPTLEWDKLPRTRLEMTARCTELGIPAGDGGFLPYRIEELYVALVNAMKADRRNAVLLAGLIAHYAADATQPLHVTADYDGRPDPSGTGERRFKGIHARYEVTFAQDPDLGFRDRARAAARPPNLLSDVHEATMEVLRASYACVEPIYAAAERHPGDNPYAAWDAEIGDLTAERLGAASTFIASLWLSAWEDAGRPELPDR